MTHTLRDLQNYKILTFATLYNQYWDNDICSKNRDSRNWSVWSRWQNVLGTNIELHFNNKFCWERNIYYVYLYNSIAA